MPIAKEQIQVTIHSQFQVSCGGYAQANNLVALLAETKSTAYVDLGVVPLDALVEVGS